VRSVLAFAVLATLSVILAVVIHGGMANRGESLGPVLTLVEPLPHLRNGRIEQQS
jgi:hypothetical protein